MSSNAPAGGAESIPEVVTEAEGDQKVRLDLLAQLEKALDARMIVYVTGDRQGFQTVIAPDAQSIIFSHLATLEPSEGVAEPKGRIGLYLYTVGGITTAAWSLVSLVREFTDHFLVLVPYKAHSAGTLVALGADSLYMSRMAQLSPVDASLTSPYNPPVPIQQPGSPPQFLPVSVEAVVGYLNLAKKEVGLHEDNALASVLGGLTQKVHPLALGEVYRSRELSADIASRLLRTGTRDLAQSNIDKIVETLTKRLGSHNYTFGRRDACDLLGNWVKEPSPQVESLMMRLFAHYSKILQLNRIPSLEDDLGSESQRTMTYVRAIVESTTQTDEFITVRKIQRTKLPAQAMGGSAVGLPPVEGYQQTLLREGWYTVRRPGP